MNNSDQDVLSAEMPIAPEGPRAFLEGLTGPSRGQIFWLFADRICATVGNDRRLRITAVDQLSETVPKAAMLYWDQDGYRIEAWNKRPIWVNGHKVTSVHLMHGDMIEFEEHGPMTRYRLGDQPFPRHWPFEEILGDAWAYARSSRRPLRGRISTALGEGLRRTAVQTTLAFRLSIIVVLCLLAGLGAVLYQNDRKMQAILDEEARRIEAVTLVLAQTRDDALSRDDLIVLQQQLEKRLDQNTVRLGALEQRSEAASRVIAASAPSVAFIQGAFGLRHMESGEFLKQVIGPDGETLRTPFGQPRLDPFGNGAPAEFQFTGTGFLLDDGQHIVTNQHVAQPWRSNQRAPAFAVSGLMPEMLRQIAFFPGVTNSVDTVLLGVSETADLAILSIAPAKIEGRGLTLSQVPPRAGDEVFLLGYPTGLKALLAQAGTDFIDALQASGAVDFWTVADLLSSKALIQPLASQGIVARINAGAVLYDAETTVGASGGPALDRNGRVVAVNAAIIPEFGGSNMGVPVSHLEAIIQTTIGD